MGREALLKTRHNFTTQKAESTNNTFSVTNPKHMLYSRNGANMDHSAIHMKNNNIGDSIMMKAKACGVPLTPNSPALKALRQLNKRQAYWRLRCKSSRSRMRRVTLRRWRYSEYDSNRNQSCYLKGQMDSQ